MPVTTRKKMAASSGERASQGRRTGGLRNDLKQFTRERILAAAMTSFQEIGFKETTVERIVELAGTTAPTFYRHFNGKDDLLTPLQAHLSVLVQSCLDRLTARDIVSAQAFTRWVGDYMRMWGEVHRLCKAFWDAASMEEEMMPSTFNRMFYTGNTIDRLFPGATGAEIEERKMRLGLLMLMLDRLAYLASVAPDAGTRDKLIFRFAEMMWRSVFTDVNGAARHAPSRKR